MPIERPQFPMIDHSQYIRNLGAGSLAHDGQAQKKNGTVQTYRPLKSQKTDGETGLYTIKRNKKSHVV
ncbi:hypothetical protein PSSHI_12440 [Photobacterium sp. R1]